MIRLLFAAFLATITSLALAQPAGVKRIVVIRGDSNSMDRETIVARVEMEPGAAVGPHSHHGDEIGYLQDGEVEMQIIGEAPRMLRTGDGFIIPAGKVHDARNIGASTARVIVTYVVEKGKPLAVPTK